MSKEHEALTRPWIIYLVNEHSVLPEYEIWYIKEDYTIKELLFSDNSGGVGDLEVIRAIVNSHNEKLGISLLRGMR